MTTPASKDDRDDDVAAAGVTGEKSTNTSTPTPSTNNNPHKQKNNKLVRDAFTITPISTENHDDGGGNKKVKIDIKCNYCSEYTKTAGRFNLRNCRVHLIQYCSGIDEDTKQSLLGTSRKRMTKEKNRREGDGNDDDAKKKNREKRSERKNKETETANSASGAGECNDAKKKNKEKKMVRKSKKADAANAAADAGNDIVTKEGADKQKESDDAECPPRFEVYVSKDTFKFNAAHFVAFPGFRERLHGHSYRASIRLGGQKCPPLGRDGYLIDFGCVKNVAKTVCKELNEYFLVPMLSEVMDIQVVGANGDDGAVENVTIKCEDGAVFVFPKSDCLLLPIMHSTAEELAVYIYSRVIDEMDEEYLHKRGVEWMEVTVAESVGQEAVFCKKISQGANKFDVAAYISTEDIPPMPCPTETKAANARNGRKGKQKKK
jgi:6-pyruvoyl-tetrahydropterin synthase